MVYISLIPALYEAQRLRDKKFIILSNNCWGSGLYKSVGRPYNTPFVGLFIKPDSYIKLLENLDENLKQKLDFVADAQNECAYPVGVLPGGIFIHFMHYESKEIAREKWERRVRRFFEDRKQGVPLFVKLCDCDGCTREQIERFLKLPFEHKLALGIGKFEANGYLCVPRLQSRGKIFNGQKLFEYRCCYFDVTRWILSGEIGKTKVSRIVDWLSLEFIVYKAVCYLRGFARIE